MISVAHEEGNLNDVRAQLGNDVAIKAYREGKLPFPNSTIIVAALELCRVGGKQQSLWPPKSFVAGPTRNIQLMVKDSRKYTATGGWDFADSKDGKPADEAVHKTCLPPNYASAIVAADEIVGSISSLSPSAPASR